MIYAGLRARRMRADKDVKARLVIHKIGNVKRAWGPLTVVFDL